MKFKSYIFLGLMMITLSGCGSGFEWFPGTPQPLKIYTTTLPDAVVGTPYNQTLIAGGGKTPYAWTLDAASGPLPDGLSLNFYGVISGTPTSTSTTQTFTVKVVDSANPNVTATQSLTITIPAAPVTITTTSSLPNGTVGTPYSTITFAASGGTGPYKNWSTAKITANCPPKGLTLDRTSGQFSGTPSLATGVPCDFNVTVTDSTTPTPMTATSPFTILVTAVPLAITTSSPLRNATQFKNYTTTFSASGGNGAYRFLNLSTASGRQLPYGLNLNINGLLSGAPTSPAAIYNFTVQVTDTTSPTSGLVSKIFFLTVQ